jgi:uncharacterized protein (TIGR01244 family)
MEHKVMPRRRAALALLTLLFGTAAMGAAEAPAVASAAPPGGSPTPASAGAGAAAPTSAAIPEPRFPELPNFHRVDEHVFRSGQPGADGFARLKTLGVRTVLNLRFEREQGRAEEAAAKAAGLQYLSIPMYPLLPPTRAQIAQALALLEDAQSWPVLVHCQAGSDRTGVVVACYRIAHEGWSAARAIQEAMGYGMNVLEVFKRAFIRDFHAPAARLATAAGGGEVAALQP